MELLDLMVQKKKISEIEDTVIDIQCNLNGTHTKKRLNKPHSLSELWDKFKMSNTHVVRAYKQKYGE